jgi:hypothetical protein
VGSGLPTAGSRSTAQNHPYARAPDPRAHINHTFYCFTDVYLLKFQTSQSTEPARENTEKRVNFSFSSFLQIGYHSATRPSLALTVCSLQPTFSPRASQRGICSILPILDSNCVFLFEQLLTVILSHGRGTPPL